MPEAGLGPLVWVIDNFDSFTYNLVDYLHRAGARTWVARNDTAPDAFFAAHAPDGILISPGPGRPADAGCAPAIVRTHIGTTPILGVCLGHQLIAEFLGGQVVRAIKPMHGKVSEIIISGGFLFRGTPRTLNVMRYHSLVVAPGTLPPELTVTACTHDGEIMALEHLHLPVAGVQFHPESVLTEHGETIIRNWVLTLMQRPATEHGIPYPNRRRV